MRVTPVSAARSPISEPQQTNERYQARDRRIVDYRLTLLEGTGLRVRGTVDPSRPFGVALGSAATFGRFVACPFPEIVAAHAQIPVLNLGLSGAGPRFFLKRPELLALINRAEFVVVEAMSARQLARSPFEAPEHPGVGGMSAASAKAARHGGNADPDEPSVASATRAADRLQWLREMSELLRRIAAPRTCLLWFSKRTPEHSEATGKFFRYWADMPQLIDRALLDAVIARSGVECIEVVSTEGLPQPITDLKSHEPIEIWPQIGFPNVKERCHNHYYPSPQMHVTCAGAVADWLRRKHPVPRPRASKSPRRVILHHHIFKNAGSSIDRALADALGTRWRAFDPQIIVTEVDHPIDGKLAKKKSSPDSVGADELERLFTSNPELDAISTHQGRGKYTLGPTFEKLELSLIRNPIGRALSMWKFNRRADRQLTIDTHLVRQAGLLPFENFIKWCINRKQHPLTPFSNFQVRLLSGNAALHGRVSYSDLERATDYVTRIGCVGVVEKFEQTLDYFNRRLDAFIPGVELCSHTVNTSGGARESGDEEARGLLTKRTYEALLEANALDLALYARVLEVGGY